LQFPSFDTLLYNYKFSFNMQFTCSGNVVVKYLVSIGLRYVYAFLFSFYHCVIAFTAFIILPMYYGRFFSEIKPD